ncbi:potassium/proton antiporter [Actinomarinicola tropica]|uniref:Potassium/proton antiporter n=1 Tax=Actinomarinicola tropica TaxID=2789776 RepID=A0A5Q2RLG6_9ACTN|nr:potassium/proton antiporter [Actinomarinicola tropica]QGG95421.1 potassium/proton antiporter [Actinomarinicola tropica]
MADLNTLITVASLLALVGVTASKLSARLGVPVLLLFLGVGMLAGSDGVGGIEFASYDLTQSLGVVALAYILFSGGLDTSWGEVRPVLLRGGALAMVGTLITGVITGLVASVALDLPLEVGLLLGAIVCSTDAAAVFAVLRSRAVSLKGSLRPLLELESGSNDPMAVFLTIGMIEIVNESVSSPLALLPLFATQMAIGGLAGIVAGHVGARAINAIKLDFEGLYPVFSIALVGLTYGVTALLGGSGFLAVYIAGLLGSRSAFVHKNSIIRFHDGIAWVAQVALFVVLGLLVFPRELPDVALDGLVVAAALIFLARPIAVFITLLPFRSPLRETAFVSWVGLRGAAPIILATFPLIEGVEDAHILFDIVFFIVLTSVLVQGTTIPFVARLLGVAKPMETRTPWPLVAAEVNDPGAALQELEVPESSLATGRSIVELGLPTGTMIVLIEHDQAFAVPTGATRLREGDRLLVIGSDEGVQVLRSLLEPLDDLAGGS